MGVLRYGTHPQLEDEANALLKRDLSRNSSLADRADILTPSKEALRRRKEVFVRSGTPDPSVRSGIYGRAINPSQPHLNSRDGTALPIRKVEGSRSTSGLADFMDRMLST